MNHYEDEDRFEDQAAALAVLDAKGDQEWRPKRTFTPQKVVTPLVNKRYEEMDLCELEGALEKESSLMAQHYEMHKAMPDMGFNSQVQKTAFKISLIKTSMMKLDPSLKTPVPAAKIKQKHVAHIQSLNVALIARNAEIKELKEKNEAYKTRANQFELFKNVVMNELGIDKYLELLSKVNEE